MEPPYRCTTEDYLYDASGERVLRRVVKSTGTQFFTYPFGLMDSTYTSSGVQALENDSYTLASQLIGERESGVTVFLLTDELGSVLTSLSAAAGSAAVTSTQVYSPYGSPRYRKGTAPTTKGFTGQYHDVSGLDSYHARYYDPVVGRFVSADIKQGNGQGMDPYSYVGNNPETRNDPTGQRYICPHCGDPGSSGGGGTPSPDPPPCNGHNQHWCRPDGGSLTNPSHGAKGPPASEKKCENACRVELAQDAANGTQRFFNRLGWLLGILGVLLALGGALLQAFSIESDLTILGIPLGVALHVLGLALIGYGPMVTLLGLEAGFFSGEFSRQGGWGSDKWTTENIEAFRQEQLGNVTFAENMFKGISLVIRLAMNLLPGDAAFIAIGAEIGSLDAILVQSNFASIINGTINQEEAVLDPHTVIPCDITPECH